MNEIITFGKGYTLNPGIKVFIKSAKNICDNVTVLSSDLGQDVKQFAEQANANFYDVAELTKKYNVNNIVSPYTLKVIYFYLYCKHISTAENVYVCDFTDTFFNKNVFEIVDNKKPYVTTENFFIKDCPTNQTWLNVCYNADILNLLSKYEIINGTGNVFGNRLAVVELLKEVCVDLAQIMSRVGSYPTIDQASLNKVVRFDAFRYNILNNFEIFNLAHFGNSVVKITSDNKVKIDSKEPYVIHQYDVIKTLETHLYKVYAK
jgi:hypothetical protein